MPRTTGIVLVVMSLALLPHLPGAARAESLVLARHGEALEPVVVSANASDETKALAAELADYLGRMADARFAVQPGDGSRGIVLGALAEFPVPALEEGLAIRNTYDGREAFAIRTEKDRLLLIGATERAVPHAAFALLENLGCRWFFPAKPWEVVPRRPELAVALDVTDRPRILARRIWYGYGPFPDDKEHPLGRSCQQDYADWARHNRMASSFRVHAGHAYEAMVATHKKLFEEHPEYLALVKGQRQGPQLCPSNPAVRELAVAWARDALARQPDQEMVSLECADGNGQCECAECAKLGSVSNRVFGLANHAAKELARTHPGKMIGVLAYNEHSEPPDFALEPNVYVQLTMGFIRGRYRFEELRDMWPKKCRSMGFYDYYSVWLWDFDKLPGGRGADLSHIAETIRTWAALGATSIDAESGNNWGVHGLGYYVANKLMWNPQADVEAITADFYQSAFGPAASVMRRYYERWQPDRQPLISRGLVGELLRDLDEAARLSKDRPDVLARLDHLKHYLRYVHLRWQFDHEKDKAKQKQLAQEILTFAYRTRYEYMNHWNAIQTSFAADVAKKFDEPAWERNSREAKPWSGAAPVSAEETVQWFREGLDYFQPTPAEEVTFACDDLVPVNLPSSAPPAPLAQAFQREETYALASVAGEPIEATITVGTIAWYRDRPDATWTLKDAKGALVAQGRQKLDGEPHKLTMAVPGPGVYYFACDESATGWRIEVAAERPAVWLGKRGGRVIPLGQCGERFFYVPRGTRSLHVFYSGTPCKVLGPDRKVVAEIITSDEIVTIAVPEGADGKPWSLSPHSHSQLWLLNAPNVLAASPTALLLPRELVEKESR